MLSLIGKCLFMQAANENFDLIENIKNNFMTTINAC